MQHLVQLNFQLRKEIGFGYFPDAAGWQVGQCEVFDRMAYETYTAVVYGVHHFAHLVKLSFGEGDFEPGVGNAVCVFLPVGKQVFRCGDDFRFAGGGGIVAAASYADGNAVAQQLEAVRAYGVFYLYEVSAPVWPGALEQELCYYFIGG